MSEIRDIGDIVSYNREDDYQFHTTTGETLTCSYAFFVPEKSPKTQHINAENWSKGNSKNTTKVLENRFKRVYFESHVKARLSRKVAGIAVETFDGEFYRIEVDLSEVISYIIPLFNINNGVIEEEVKMAKVGSRWTPVPYTEAIKSIEEKNKEKTRITKTKLKVGTRYVTATLDMVYLGIKNNKHMFGMLTGYSCNNSISLQTKAGVFKLFDKTITVKQLGEFFTNRTDVKSAFTEDGGKNVTYSSNITDDEKEKFRMSHYGYSTFGGVYVIINSDNRLFSQSNTYPLSKISLNCTDVQDDYMREEECAIALNEPEAYKTVLYNTYYENMRNWYGNLEKEPHTQVNITGYDPRYQSLMDDLKNYCITHGV